MSVPAMSSSQQTKSCENNDTSVTGRGRSMIKTGAKNRSSSHTIKFCQKIMIVDFFKSMLQENQFLTSFNVVEKYSVCENNWNDLSDDSLKIIFSNGLAQFVDRDDVDLITNKFVIPIFMLESLLVSKFDDVETLPTQRAKLLLNFFPETCQDIDACKDKIVQCVNIILLKLKNENMYSSNNLNYLNIIVEIIEKKHYRKMLIEQSTQNSNMAQILSIHFDENFFTEFQNK